MVEHLIPVLFYKLILFLPFIWNIWSDTDVTDFPLRSSGDSSSTLCKYLIIYTFINHVSDYSKSIPRSSCNFHLFTVSFPRVCFASIMEYWLLQTVPCVVIWGHQFATPLSSFTHWPVCLPHMGCMYLG